jgi:hypothetical protein
MSDDNAKAVAAPSKAQLVAGNKIAAIVPRDFESAYRMAQVVVAAHMTPKSIETVEQACVAIMHGLEVGLTPMAALQSIAVINGMPTIWGDGMLGLIRASGLLEDIVEEVELDDKGEPLIATCKVKRKGESSWAISSFTRVEAQRAGLWNKAGPWQGYRPRMMKMRARSWALRDKFPDVLRGLHSAEEAQDMLDITPRARVVPPEPRRNDVPVVPTPEQGAAGGDAPRKTPAAAAATPSRPPTPADELDAGESEPPPSRKNWRIDDDVLGQEAFLKAFNDLLDMVESDIEQDELCADNAERLAKVTGNRKSELVGKLRDARLLRRQRGGNDGQEGG